MSRKEKRKAEDDRGGVESRNGEELPEKYIVRILFGQNNKKFEDEYLKKLERNWVRWKGKEIGERGKFLWSRNLKRGVLL